MKIVFSHGRDTQHGISGFCEQAEFSYCRIIHKWYATVIKDLPQKHHEYIHTSLEPRNRQYQFSSIVGFEKIREIKEDTFDPEFSDEVDNIDKSNFRCPNNFVGSVSCYSRFDLYKHMR